MMANKTINLNDLLTAFLDCFPLLNFLEQRLSLEIYRLLAQGEPVSRTTLAQRLEVPVEVVNQSLDRWPGVYSDSERRLVGYWGLSIPAAYKGPHQMRLSDRTLSAWCAWDTLFLPQLLGQTAKVESSSPSGGTVSLTVTPDSIERINPVGSHMSFLMPDRAAVQKDVVATFCHFIYFFPSRQAGETWAGQHPGTLILSMSDAFSLARRKNEEQYKEILGSQA